MGHRFKVVCGACKCAPGLTPGADGEVVICPGCGQSDSVDEAFRIAGEHDALRTARGGQRALTELPFRWHAVSA